MKYYQLRKGTRRREQAEVELAQEPHIRITLLRQHQETPIADPYYLTRYG